MNRWPVVVFLILFTIVEAVRADTDCDNHSSVDNLQCTVSKYQYTKIALDALEHQILTKEIPSRAVQSQFLSADGWKNTFIETEKDWRNFVSNDCEGLIGKEWFEGSGSQFQQVKCKLQKTQARLRELRARYLFK